MLGSPCSPKDSEESSLTPQFKSINSLVLSFRYRNMNVVPTDCSEAELGSINMVPTGKRKRLCPLAGARQRENTKIMSTSLCPQGTFQQSAICES